LLNLAGQVVGINTATIPSAHGIGFAIAVNTAKLVLRELIATGRVVRPSLGLMAVSVTPQVAYANELPVERGVLVLRLEEVGPAAAAGVAPGDVITALHGRPVRDLHELHERLSRHRVGEEVSLSVLRRGGQVLTVRPVLGREQ
jgi:S1-C subfamily serine protease